MLRIGLLCSGNLGFKALEFLKEQGHNLLFVLTDNNSTDIITYCQQNSIKVFSGNPRNGKGFDFIKSFPVDVITSVNYLFLIEKDIIEFPKILSFNIHGSLLPKYRGRTPHVWAIINNEKKAGITAHTIDTGCDSGEIIEQVEIKIEDSDTGMDLLNKYHEKYNELLALILEDIEKGTLNFTKQDESKATYFGKRTPADGLINWNWSKERINNWVRAQSYPYPGAFTFYNGEKVIIDKIKFSELGYRDSHPNGIILDTKENVVVKTPNGAIELVVVRNKEVNFKANELLLNN